MEPAILIPTFAGHLHFNEKFLLSIRTYCTDAEMPLIYFATSTSEEAEDLRRICSGVGREIARKTRVFDVKEKVDDFYKYKSDTFDIDGNMHARGHIGLVNLKKIAGLVSIFGEHDRVIILDSEVTMFRPGSMLDFVRRSCDSNEYRYSFVAYNGDLAAKIQHDSIRSVLVEYNTSLTFARSYGWFDNICVYEKRSFYDFMSHMSPDDPSDPLQVCTIFRGLTFEWIAYKAFQILVRKRPVDLINLDDRFAAASPLQQQPVPLTENIHGYMTGDVERDARLLRAIDPPWIPATKRASTLAAINEALPTRCCLMFHHDRDTSS